MRRLFLPHYVDNRFLTTALLHTEPFCSGGFGCALLPASTAVLRQIIPPPDEAKRTLPIPLKFDI
ncbi:MAG: hypothetical protein B7Y53_08310, partial [Halothiobacillus sp. 28-55-5]